MKSLLSTYKNSEVNNCAFITFYEQYRSFYEGGHFFPKGTRLLTNGPWHFFCPIRTKTGTVCKMTRADKFRRFNHVQTYHFRHRSNCSVNSFCIRRQTNGIYSLIKTKCNNNSTFEILVTSLCNASSNILQILSY